MLKAKPANWAKFVFRKYLENLFKRNFNNLSYFGKLPQCDPELPILLVPNHSTWWDGLFTFYLNEVQFKRSFYVMMLERELKKYPFFQRIGAYSVAPDKPKSTLESLNYTCEILKMDEPILLNIFPQGELLPWHKRPLGYRSGIDWILKKHNKAVNILPMGIRIEHRETQHADVYFQYGENMILCKKSFPGIGWLEEIQEGLLDEMQDNIISNKNALILNKNSVLQTENTALLSNAFRPAESLLQLTKTQKSH